VIAMSRPQIRHPIDPRAFKSRFSVPWAVAALAATLVVVTNSSAQAALYTVGPHGGYSTIQAAVDDCAVGVDTEIRIEAATTFTENVVIPATFSAGSITLIGGWDAGFSTRDHSPTVTVIDGGAAGSVVEVRIAGGTVTLDGLTLTNGLADAGGGLYADPQAPPLVPALITVQNCDIRDNAVTSSGPAIGGGLSGLINNSERLEVLDCDVFDNTATGTGSSVVAGGGMRIAVSGSASLLVQSTHVEENAATSDHGPKNGAGVYLSVSSDASAEIDGLWCSGNTASGTHPAADGSGMYFELHGAAQIVARRGALAMNSDLTGGSGAQISILIGDTASLTLSDFGIALGSHDGISGIASSNATLRLVNLTVVDHPGTGVALTSHDASVVSLYNSIADGNGIDAFNLGPPVVTGSNLIGVDPLFVNPAGFNYRLDEGSPGVDAGTNSAPGGLGTVDLDGRTRIQDGTVDIGCYEGEGMLFYDGFEGGGTGEWSTAVP
jgi:hypothetical protein